MEAIDAWRQKQAEEAAKAEAAEKLPSGWKAERRQNFTMSDASVVDDRYDLNNSDESESESEMWTPIEASSSTPGA